MRVAVIGGGLAGLCGARELARAGHQVTVFEAFRENGGLAGSFEVAGNRLERFYHHVFATDVDFLDLVEETGLWDALEWHDDLKGNWIDGKIWPYSTPKDILTFGPMPAADRLRMAAASAWLTRVKDWSAYDGITAKAWIIKAMGPRVWRVLWEPLMASKFGPHADSINMAWFYGRVKSRFGVGKKGAPTGKLGYLKGSVHRLVQALERDIAGAGGVLRTASPVRRVHAEGGRVTGVETPQGVQPFDAVLATCAPPRFVEAAGHLLPEADRARLESLKYIGACVAVLELSESVSPTYWLNVLDKDFPFVAVIEHTRMIPREEYQGRHIVYLAKYLDTDTDFWRLPNDKVLAHNYGWLRRVLPAFDERLVLGAHVMRAEHAQPIVTPGQGGRIPPHRTAVRGLWMANMSQIYPEDRGMSYSVALGKRVAAEMAAEMKA